MKRIVTLVVSGDLPDSIAMSDCVADILEKHAQDLRDSENPAGKKAKGVLNGTITVDGTIPPRPPVPWEVEWTATYEGEPGT